MLDAIIGNTDRHHENWAIIESQESTQSKHRYAELSPTYDHASCLGREMTDNLRQFGLSGRKPSWSPASYRAKGRSAFYSKESENDALTPLGSFMTAATTFPTAAGAWLERLSWITAKVTDKLLQAIPNERISTLGRDFAAALLQLGVAELTAFQASIKA